MDFNDEFSAYDYKYISSLDLCFRCNFSRILTLFCIYFVSIYLCRNKIAKRHQLVTNVISTMCSYYSLLTLSLEILPDYYIYDTIMSVLAGDMLMISHHLFTLYCLSFCTTDSDYYIINYCFLMFKFSDVFVNHYKITDALGLYEKYPIGIRIYQLMSIILTMLLWIPFRLILPFFVYPFNCISMNLLGGTLHIINFYWMKKFWHLAKKIGREMGKHIKLEPEEEMY